MTLTIGVDIGGTKIAAGVVDEEGKVVADTRRESPAQHPDAIADSIAEVVVELRTGHEVAAVGLAAAGLIDRAGEDVMFAPNLAWRDEPLRRLVADRVHLPTVMDNDANAAAWAEYRFGAGQGARTLLMAVIGTGIGGGLVIGGPENGAVFRGGFGAAAEFGHLRVVPNGRLCPCGLHGCWEAYGSGTGLTARARELAQQEPEAAAVMIELAGGDPHDIRGPMVSEAAERGDPAAKQSFAELAHWIGEGLASLGAILDPDVILVGGGVSESPELDLNVIISSFRAAETGFAYRPTPAFKLAELGNQAGMIGAADLARVPL